jgi:hypothetical protein
MEHEDSTVGLGQSHSTADDDYSSPGSSVAPAGA